MKKSELHRQLLDILSDRNLDVDAQAVSIEALFEQYLSSHDNKLLNSLSDVFDLDVRHIHYFSDGKDNTKLNKKI